MTLDVRRLALLRQVAVRGSIAATARALSFTPSAISQQLSVLQREAGVVLLERAGRGLRLTEAGHRLVARTEAILAELDGAEADLAALGSTPAGDLTIGAFPTGAATILAAACADLAGRHPVVRITMVEGTPGQSLLALRLGELDVVLGYEYPYVPLCEDGAIERRDLFVDPLVLLLPAGLFPADRMLRLADLSLMPWAMAPAGLAYGDGVRRACLTAGFDPDVRFQTYDVSVMQALVAGGLAVAIVPRLGLKAHPLPAGVEQRTIDGPELARRVFVAVRAGRRSSPALTAIIDALVAAASQVTNRPAGGPEPGAGVVPDVFDAGVAAGGGVTQRANPDGRASTPVLFNHS